MKKLANIILLFIPALLCAQQNNINYTADTNARKVQAIKYDNPQLLVNCCVGTAPNNNFASATALTINAAAINGFTCGGSIEVGESKDCNSTANQSVWYKFVATATTTYVVIDVSGTGTGCYSGSAVWQTNTLPTGSCHPISCQAADYGPIKTVHQVSTTIGATYYVQVLYTTGGICGTGGCFKINASNTNPGGITNAPPANTCPTANSTCWFASPPTIAQVTAGCTQYTTAQGPNIVNSVWLQFTTGPNSSTININGLITSNCGGGNIDWFEWALYDASCTTQIACGIYPTLSITGAACSTTYNILISWETAGCTWSSWYWYLNAPTAPPPCTALPIELSSFTGHYSPSAHANAIAWACQTETNNNYFVLQRSSDGMQFSNVCVVPGAGNSVQPTYYNYNDGNFVPGSINYYRLLQVDYSGAQAYSYLIAIDNTSIVPPVLMKVINELGQPVPNDYKGFRIEVYNDGSVIKKIN